MGHHNNVSRFKNGTAIVLSFAVFLVFPFAQSTSGAFAQDKAGAIDPTPDISASQDGTQELTLSSASAVSTRDGVFLQWHTSFELDNVGFNIFRVRNGQRTRANRSIIPGSVF